ncbi:MAG: thioredoxin family protein [Phycisphaeraceae bacterium]|nr:thioredoxin family protein [Phycisphaeraceae bacterium]
MEDSPTMLDTQYLKAKHNAGLSYEQYLATGKPNQVESWRKVESQVSLTQQQKDMLGGFVRSMKVLFLSGIWCGDCVRQGPMLSGIAVAAGVQGGGRISLRFLDRDQHVDLQQQVPINGGHRVPVVIFCAEDDHLVGWYGDRTLSRYRLMAAAKLGSHCPLPGGPLPQVDMEDELADWVSEFERVHLLLRLSTRLRQKHGD